MNRFRLTGQRLTAVFLLGLVLLNYPLLFLFDGKAVLYGIPLLYVYVFFTWAALIALMAWIIERRRE